MPSLRQENVIELLHSRNWKAEDTRRKVGKGTGMQAGLSISAQYTNGMRVSLQASAFHYCEPREYAVEYLSIEVAIFTEDDEWYTDSPRHTGDQVLGWVEYQQLLEILAHVETRS